MSIKLHTFENINSEQHKTLSRSIYWMTRMVFIFSSLLRAINNSIIFITYTRRVSDTFFLTN